MLFNMENLSFLKFPIHFFFKIFESIKLELPIGQNLHIEFISDNSTQNDGFGFRLEWKCEPFKTIIV